MSFNLGNWAEKLSCDMCTGALPPDLSLPPDYFEEGEGGLPDDFWDEPPDDPEPFDPLDLLPDPYPYLEFPDGGFIFGIKGTF